MNDVDFAIYADDNTPFFVGNDLDEVIFKLQSASKTLSQWFADNQRKLTQINVISSVALT